MLEPSTQAVVDQARALPAAEIVSLYLALVEDVPKNAHVAAVALRDKARAGEVGAELVPVLAACIAEDPDPQSLVHLAKAAAAVGRAAAAVVPALAAQIRRLAVTDDVAFWILDGCVWAAAYAGGGQAAPFLEELAAEPKSRAVRSDSVYRGEMPSAARQERYASTLARALELARGSDPGPWREKRTSLKAQKPPKPQVGSSLLAARRR